MEDAGHAGHGGHGGHGEETMPGCSVPVVDSQMVDKMVHEAVQMH